MLCTCTLSVVPRIQRPAILLYRYTVVVMCCNIDLFKRDVTCLVTPTMHCSVNKYR